MKQTKKGTEKGNPHHPSDFFPRHKDSSAHKNFNTIKCFHKPDKRLKGCT